MTEKNNKKTIFGWSMYDWAKSAYETTTLGAIMPVLEVLVEISGGGGGDDGSGHVSFEGFSFRHATWLRPGQEDGYVEQQCGACAVGTNENNHECDKVSQTLTMS